MRRYYSQGCKKCKRSTSRMGSGDILLKVSVQEEEGQREAARHRGEEMDVMPVGPRLPEWGSSCGASVLPSGGIW